MEALEPAASERQPWVGTGLGQLRLWATFSHSSTVPWVWGTLHGLGNIDALLAGLGKTRAGGGGAWAGGTVGGCCWHRARWCGQRPRGQQTPGEVTPPPARGDPSSPACLGCPQLVVQ